MNRRALIIVAAALPITIWSVMAPATATPPVDEIFVPLAFGTMEEAVRAKASTDGWKMRIDATDATDTLTAEVVHPPGSSSGWHKHAGPVIVTVVEGTLTFYFGDDPTCSPTLVRSGQSIVETGGARAAPHYAVNEGSEDARLFVTMFAPAGMFPRIDVPAPGNCPF